MAEGSKKYANRIYFPFSLRHSFWGVPKTLRKTHPFFNGAALAHRPDPPPSHPHIGFMLKKLKIYLAKFERDSQGDVEFITDIKNLLLSGLAL